MKYLSQLKTNQLSGKVAIVRVDFNIENTAQIFRLQATLPTIQYLIKKKVTVILMSHRGRPKKKFLLQEKISASSKESLRIVLPFLKKHLKRDITFLPQLKVPFIQKKVLAARPGAVFLLENLRLLKGEKENSLVLATELARMGDLYVNDAFASSHRKDASIHRLPALLPSYVGLLLEKELVNLDIVQKTKKRPLVVILGGAKVSDKLGVMRHLFPHTSYFLIGGLAANTFLKAGGYDIKKSGYEPKMIPVARRLLKSHKIIMPVDFLEENEKIFDIGPISADLFSRYISAAKTILWNGPMGYFEKKKFASGTVHIARALAHTKEFVVAGGGETTQLIYELHLQKKYNFISTGGGAMLAYLSGKELPGLTALKKSRKQL